MSCAALVVGVQLGDVLRNGDRADRGSQPPTRHRELLGERVEDDRAVDHARQRSDGMAVARIPHLKVGLVSQHPQVVLDREVRNRLHLLRRALAAKGVLQVVVDDRSNSARRAGGGDETAQVIEIDRKAGVGLHVAVGQAPAAVVLDHAFVDGVAGIGVEHALAGVHHRLDELADHGLAAGLHHHVGRRIAEPAAAADVGGERLTKGHDASGRAVAGLALGNGDVHRLGDVGRRGQVDVAEVEREDPIPLRCPIGSGQRDGERGLRAQIGEPFCQRHCPASRLS